VFQFPTNQSRQSCWWLWYHFMLVPAIFPRNQRAALFPWLWPLGTRNDDCWDQKCLQHSLAHDSHRKPISWLSLVRVGWLFVQVNRVEWGMKSRVILPPPYIILRQVKDRVLKPSRILNLERTI
jgi:hypothetical protein